MRSLPKSFLPILIASVLLLSAVKNGRAQLASPRQTPNQDKRAEPAQTSADDDQRNPKNPSSSPDNLVSPTAPQSTPTANPPKKDTAYYEDAIVVSSIAQAVCAALLVVITYLLVCVGRTQAGWMEKQAEWMGKTNMIYDDQKKLLRQQTILAHRPRIRVRYVTVPEQLRPNEFVQVELTLANVGGSTATIEKSNFTVWINSCSTTPWRKLNHTPEPYEGSQSFFQTGGGTILEAGWSTNPFAQKSAIPLTQDQYLAILGLRETVYAVGFIHYRDDVSQYHKTAFCRRLDYQNGRFIAVKDADLEFED
jgi:hypothetical protein